MHNEYVRSCIRNDNDELLLLKYQDINIAGISDLLYKLTIDLMDKCYSYIELFGKKNKNYNELRTLILKQLSDMLFIKKKFIEYYSKHGLKNKEELLTYVIASQITSNHFNQYLYGIVNESLKREVGNNFWNNHNLDRFEANDYLETNFSILRDTKNECNIGNISIDINDGVNIFDKYIIDNKKDKLDLSKKVGNILDNRYNKDFPILNNPYKNYILDLVDHIKVYQDSKVPVRIKSKKANC